MPLVWCPKQCHLSEATTSVRSHVTFPSPALLSKAMCHLSKAMSFVRSHVRLLQSHIVCLSTATSSVHSQIRRVLYENLPALCLDLRLTTLLACCAMIHALPLIFPFSFPSNIKLHFGSAASVGVDQSWEGGVIKPGGLNGVSRRGNVPGLSPHPFPGAGCGPVRRPCGSVPSACPRDSHVLLYRRHWQTQRHRLAGLPSLVCYFDIEKAILTLASR